MSTPPLHNSTQSSEADDQHQHDNHSEHSRGNVVEAAQELRRRSRATRSRRQSRLSILKEKAPEIASPFEPDDELEIHQMENNPEQAFTTVRTTSEDDMKETSTQDDNVEDGDDGDDDDTMSDDHNDDDDDTEKTHVEGLFQRGNRRRSKGCCQKFSMFFFDNLNVRKPSVPILLTPSPSPVLL